MASFSFNYVLVVFPFILLAIISSSRVSAWTATFVPNNNKTIIQMQETLSVNLTIQNLNATYLIREKATIGIISDSDILKVSHQILLDDIIDGEWTGEFNVTGDFLGNARIFVEILSEHGNIELSNETLAIVIIREEKLIDKIFNISVAALVSILYINFGAAMDMEKVKEILVRPIGPLLAIICKFLFMPLLSYFLGIFLFPNNVEMQLGLFFSGVTPSGGASNIWSLLLDGNVSQSLAMTTINTIAAFVMMPIWIFTLGSTIFDRGQLIVPYGKIAMYAICLIVPLGIGLFIQKRLPNLAKILVRILKSFSGLLIIFIIVFAIITNLYLFELFTWQIFVAGLGLPWIGYIVGWAASSFMKQKHEDCVAISIEAGIQNTGIAIFILRFALGQPQADLTTVIPVSVAIMTPFPLLFYYLYLKGKDRFSKNRRGVVAVPTNPPVRLETFNQKSAADSNGDTQTKAF